MTDMIERAVAAIAKRTGGTDEEYARDALLAALDPEDEALIEHVARAMCVELGLHADDWSEDAAGERIHVWQKEAGTAREAIAAMRSYTAQGETAP